MKNAVKQDLSVCIENFALPSYGEIPNVGLYLEQTIKYINSFFSSFPEMELTGSMVSNYVKKGLISNAVKKQYSREQIAQLFFITVAKLSVSIDGLATALAVQKATYSTYTAYEYFRLELMNVLAYVFGQKESLETVGVENTEQKYFLRTTIMAVAHKMFLDKYIASLTAGDAGDSLTS